MPRNPHKIRCKAKSKRTGEQCKRWATKGYRVCRYHGANPGKRGGAPARNKNAMTYGAFVDELLNEDEKEMFELFYQEFLDDFELVSFADKKAVEKACKYYIRLYRALKSDNIHAIIKLDNLVHKQTRLIKSISERHKAGSLENIYPPWALKILAKARDENG